MTTTSKRKVALITGGAKGIGRAIALELAQDHDVAITWHKTPPNQADNVYSVQADLQKPETPKLVIDAVIDKFGRLDVIVNNAGVIAPAGMQDYPMEDLREMFDVNILAAQGILAASLTHLTAGAAIVSISSVNAILPPKGAALYGASKVAVDLWVRGCAKELGPQGIRVNAVAPGAVNIPEAPRDAEMTALFEEVTALGRLSEPQDVAKAVRFLASDAARSITGEVLTVSGGYRL